MSRSTLPVTTSAQKAPNLLPAPTGPYAVGRMTFHWTDSTRKEVETKAAGDKRELMVHIFYPCDAASPSQPAVHLPDADAQHAEWNAATLARIGAIRTHARDGASMTRDTTRHRVILHTEQGHRSRFFLVPRSVRQ